jgi:hypothetical protein
MYATPNPPEIHIGSVARTLIRDNDAVDPVPYNQPRTLFPSELILTRQQEDAMCLFAQAGFRTLNLELGRDESATDGSIPMFLATEGRRTQDTLSTAKKFMCKRSTFLLVERNDMEWRRRLNPDAIFAQSNLTVPLSRRIAGQKAARAVNYFFGTDPWLALHAIGASDLELSKKLQRLLDIKMIESGSLAAIRRGVASAFVLGESVMKVTKARRSKRFREMARVAVDPAGNPWLAGDGGPISETDLFIDDPATGQSVLKRDPKTPHPAGGQPLIFTDVLIDQEVVTYEGPEVTKVHFRDFLCAENATDLQSAPMIIHMMERSASSIAETYLASGDRSMSGIQKAVSLIQSALTNTTAAKGGASGPRAEYAQYEPSQAAEPTTEYGEFYFHFDADGDGVTEDIFLFMDPKTGVPIYYNYVANTTDDHQRPFYPITPSPVEGRWWGQGEIERFESHQTNIDLQYNRRNHNQSGAGRVVFWNRAATVEGDTDPNLKLNWGRTYTLKNGQTMDDALKVFYISDNKFDYLKDEVEFTLQMAMNESGVQHANDAQAAGMDSAKLATGVRNIEKSGQEMFALPISELESCLTPIVQCFNTTLFAGLKDEETFLYFEGEVPQEMVVAARDVAGLRFNIQVLLTRFREEQVLQSTSQAALLIREFYGYMPELQMIMAPLYRDMLKSLQIQRADQYIIPMGSPLTAPTGPGGSPQAPGGQSKSPAPLL